MPLQPLTVLNVNSDKTALYFSSRVLRDAHFRVLEAETIEQAVALARQRPDLIIIDTRLNKEARCDICHAAQTAAHCQNIPVLHLVSGLEDVVADVDCPLAIRSGNLHWPASASTLLSTVRELLMAPAPEASVSDEQLELLGRLTLAASYQVDRLGIVLEWGSSAERLFGWTARETLGHFLPIVDDEHRDEFLSMLASALRGQPLYRWETHRRTKSGRMITVAISMLPIFDANDTVDRIQIVAADISENRRLQVELQQLSSVVLSSEDIICIFTRTGEIEFINPAGQRLIGLAPAATKTGLEQIAPAKTCARIHQVALPRAAAEATFVEEMVLTDAEAHEIPVSLQVVRLGAAGTDRFAIVARDIRAQKTAEQGLLRSNRIQLMLGKCSQAIQQAHDEKSLFAAICHLLTDIGGYRFAMVSLIVPDPEQKMQPAAWSGDDTATMAELVTYWNPVHPRGQGPTGTAVRTGQTVIRHDIGQAPEYSPWAAINTRLGLRAMIALPLTHGTQSFGALSIYAIHADAFDAEGHEIAVSLQVLRLGAAGTDRFAIVARDIQAQKTAEQGLLRSNRIYLMLGKCNEAIQQTLDEKSLFAAICHLLTDIGGYRFSMVSLIVPDPEQKMQPAAWAGDDAVTMAELVTYWNPDHPRGRGPTGTAIRTGQTVIRHDIGQAPE
ncbi:MAG: hypothetical protein QG672_665, partial [Pseudomonadota bacterium]|nr:hypothetical protein [Pseudomonadota bacterium]